MRCVGRSGGGEIDAHEAILRVNNCPVGGFEHLVGARTTVRFLTALAALVPGPVTFQGDEHMAKRPISDLVDALRQENEDLKKEREELRSTIDELNTRLTQGAEEED